MSEENSIPKGDSKKAVAFLRWFCGDEDRTIQSIHPNTKSIKAYTFTKDQDDKLFATIERLQGVESVYFQVNPLKEPINGARKANKTDVREIRWLQVDKDPVVRRDFNEERTRIFKVLSEFHTKPNLIIDSGGGGQAFWRLETPIPLEARQDGQEPWAEGEAYSQQLALELTADPCFNCDRIMRLPFTTNMPDAKKRDKGRVPALASVIYRDEGSYPLSAFMKAPVVRVGSAEDANVSGPVREVKLSENIERLSIDEIHKLSLERGNPLQDSVRVLIVQGHDPDRPEHFKDRSKAVFYATIQMVKSKLTPDEIAAVITDPSYGISAHVLDQKRPLKYAARQIKRAQEMLVNPALQDMNERFAIIRNYAGRHVVVTEYYDMALKRTTLRHQNRDNFVSAFADQRVEVGRDENGNIKYSPLGKWWLYHEEARRYDYLVFEPGMEAEIVMPREGGRPIIKLNLWQGFACDAIPSNKHESYLTHILENICSGNQEHYEYLINWMARGVQFPNRPGEVAVVMSGARGAGKSITARLYGSLFGRHYLSISNANHLVGNFNSHLRDCCVIFADEAFYAGDKRHESVLKTLITEDSIMIEAKGLDAEMAMNCTRIIMASNNQWVVPAGGDERRFFVLTVSDRMMQNTEYFGQVIKDMENGGREALLHFLLTRDLTDFDVRKPPKTDALFNQKLFSMSFEEQWWFDKIRDGVIFPDSTGWQTEVSKNALHDTYIREANLMKRSHTLHKVPFGKFISRITGSETQSVQKWVKRPVMSDDGSYEETLTREYFFRIPTLELCREAFDKQYGKQNWSVYQSDDDAPF